MKKHASNFKDAYVDEEGYLKHVFKCDAKSKEEEDDELYNCRMSTGLVSPLRICDAPLWRLQFN